MLCVTLVPIAFGCTEQGDTTYTVKRYTVEDIEEIVQRSFFNADGSLSSEWGNIVYVYDDNEWCSELYETSVLGYNGVQVNVKYDDCNPFGIVAGHFGDITSLSKHETEILSADAKKIYNELEFIKDDLIEIALDIEVPTGGSECILIDNSYISSKYRTICSQVQELYDGSHISFTYNANSNFSKSAIVCLNYPYTLFFNEANVEADYQTALANLFGFGSKEIFTKYAQELVDIYHADFIAENEALLNGCYLNASYDTEFYSFASFPIAVKNELTSTLLMYLVIDKYDGIIYAWINDVDALLWATNFDEAHYTDGVINNELYCKNRLFVTEAEVTYCCNTQYPQYVFEKPTSFEVTLLKDAKNPKQHNYFLVEFNTSGYFVGPLIKSYNWTYLDDGFSIWPSPYKLLNIAPEDRYMYMKKGVRYKTCATIISGEIVSIDGALLDDGSSFSISPTQSICAYYSSKIDDWIRYDATTDEGELFLVYGNEAQQKQRLDKIKAEAERNPIDFQKINEEMDLLISASEYNIVRR